MSNNYGRESRKIRGHYPEVLQAVIIKLSEAEKIYISALHQEEIELACCEGVQHSLNLLKEEGFENTKFFKKLEKKLNDSEACSDHRADMILQGYGSDYFHFMRAFHDLTKRCADEPENTMGNTIVELDSELLVVDVSAEDNPDSEKSEEVI
jgi:hypothetical protein